MKRGLIFAATLTACVLAAEPAAAQDIRADTGGIAIGRDVINSTVNIGVSPEQLAALVRQWGVATESQNKLIGKLERELDLNRRQITAALKVLDEANVEPEDLGAKLVEIVERYKELLSSAATQPGDTPAIAALKTQAQNALDAGELDKADELLAAVETEQRQAAERATLDAAETSARRGDLAMTRLRYREAAKHFANAAALFVPSGPQEDKRVRYLEKEAGALLRQGDNFDEKDALRASIERCHALIALKPRDRVPLLWAAAQYRLGYALVRLGLRERGTARFEEAVAAYREAQKEFTREDQPRYWALTELSRAHALRHIAERERGRTRWDEVVAAYSRVLEVLKRKDSPRLWAAAQHHLGMGLAERGERGYGRARVKAAVAAYRRALEAYTREEDPVGWAEIQHNLAGALAQLGAHERGTARLEEALAAYQETLKEWTRERAPRRWARSQNGIANVLVRLARHEGGPARLEEAVATYDEVLKIRSRERAPLDWAQTSGRQAVALMLLAERTNNADMADRAAAQIEAALEAVRGGHAPREDYLERQLPRARALAQRLRQP